MAGHPWKRQVPNALTMGRVVMAAALVALLAMAPPLYGTADAQPILLAAVWLFVLAAVTDALDGYLARKWQVVSVFGRIMDPFADKLLVLGTVVMLATPTFEISESGQLVMAAGFTGWMAVVILGRELLVTSIRGVFEARGIDFSASFSGKAKMIIQSIAIPGCLLVAGLYGSQRPEWASWAVTLAAWGTTLVTAASAAPYITRALRAGGPDQAQDSP
ncbi:MAG: CDP-alcohol phosphatidyltransferase family protein [Phycisphaera sp.]|nr:MAG: CDP-alcohol phosphatidyltransferase family protein [Phycisphaera sp.]